MAYPLYIKEKALTLRKKGFSIKEIAKKLNIAQATSSIWVRNVNLNQKALKRIKQRKIYGQYICSQIWKKKRKQNQLKARKKALISLSNINLQSNHLKLLCSILFWAEGAKHPSQIKFINSDPNMIKVFLKLFRSCFPVKEEKLKALVHLHEYHNKTQILKFWSKKTKIPIKQFQKSYIKPHTGKRKRSNYKGCISINYYNANLARELHAIYNTFAKQFIGV